MVIGLLVLIATFVFEDKLLTTSAVGAVVVGFALQDTLGNAFAGLGIQSEKPFRVGHWIRVGEFEGRVAEVTWRATKLRTKSGNFVIVPNNIIAKDAITNYSEPAVPTRLEVEVGASYLRDAGRRQSRGARGGPTGAADLARATAGRAAALLRRFSDHVPRALLDRGLRAGRRGARRGADGDLLCVRQPRDRDPVADRGGLFARMARARCGDQATRARAGTRARRSLRAPDRRAAPRDCCRGLDSALRQRRDRSFARASPASRCSSCARARRASCSSPIAEKSR